MHFKRISQSNWTVTIIGSLIAAFLSGLLLMFVAVPYAIQKEAEKAQKNQRLAYFSSLHALRIETSQNQVFLKALPDGKAEGYIVAPTTIYAAKAVLSDMKVFEFGSRGL